MPFSLPGMMRELSTTVSPGLHRQVLVIVHGDARERRHRLALRARSHHDYLVRDRLCMMSCGRSRMPSGRLQQPHGVRDLSDVEHAAPQKCDFAAILGREIEDQLQAVDRRAEAGNHQPPFGAIENLFEARARRRVRFRYSRGGRRWWNPTSAAARRVCRSRRKCAGRTSSLSVGVGSTLKSPV